MKLYGGIDLHSTNSVVVVLDEQDRVLLERRVTNDLQRVKDLLAPFREALCGVVVESTYNWYWLVDGLMAAGYRVRLANTAAIKQYEGLKYSDDAHDARWLAHLLRLSILPTGYIYPKGARAVRDLARRRMRLVQQRSLNLLAVQTTLERELGRRVSANAIKRTGSEVALLHGVEEPNVGSSLTANLAVMRCLDAQIERLEREIVSQVKLAAQFEPLKSVAGVGQILALTIMLETGEIGRFAKVGNFASYARCVQAKRLSNGKKKGEGNAKCGNKHLAWAFIEAAHFAVRYYPKVKRFYERKRAKSNAIVAIKACAHKLARAAYHVMRTQQPFDIDRAFA